MAKFINNNTISVQNRRAAAMGFSLAAICAAIVKVSEAAKAALDRASFGFSEGSLPSETHVGIACKISSLVGYGGGYMYGGGYATVLGGDPYVRFQHLCHWAKDYDRRNPAGFLEGNLTILRGLMDGSTIRIGKDAQDSSYEEWELRQGLWVHTLSYSGLEARWEEERLNRQVYLFSGIRAAVASKLGVEADYGFHKLFDEAIISLDE